MIKFIVSIISLVAFGILIPCIETTSPLLTAPRTPPPGCFRDGKFYHEGSHIRPSPCEFCDCMNGQFQCAIADCFIVQCVDSISDPTKCCPVCPNGRNCYAGDKIIPFGPAVQIDEHTTCKCPERFGFGMSLNKAECTYKIEATKVPPTDAVKVPQMKVV